MPDLLISSSWLTFLWSFPSSHCTGYYTCRLQLSPWLFWQHRQVSSGQARRGRKGTVHCGQWSQSILRLAGCKHESAGHWNSLLRAVVMTLSLPEFNKCLDKALRHMLWFLGGPMRSQDLDSRIFMDSRISSNLGDSLTLWACHLWALVLVHTQGISA